MHGKTGPKSVRAAKKDWKKFAKKIKKRLTFTPRIAILIKLSRKTGTAAAAEKHPRRGRSRARHLENYIVQETKTSQ